MSAELPLDDPEEQAALYLAGAMEDHERRAFEDRLRSGDAASLAAVERLSGVVDALAQALPWTEPDPRVRRNLLDGLRAVGSPPGERLVRRPSATDWKPTVLAGVWYHLLRPADDRGRIAALIRMDPGSEIPEHRHAAEEELLILEGDLITAGTTLTAGDYSYAPEGGVHPVSRSDRGCVALVIAKLQTLFGGA